MLASTLEPLERYYRLLAKWNPRINLTSLPLDAYYPATLDRLVVEPLLASELLETRRQNWFDLGSGNGSPAIPLKLFRPSLSLTMVEAKARKAAFLREAVNVLGLADTKVLTERIEALPASLSGTVDIISIRAVRLDRDIAEACASLLTHDGWLMTFGRVTPVQSYFRPVMRREDQTGQLSVAVWKKSEAHLC
jgi:16S rRNA (guanine527-N7)-methyltransferase